MKQFIFSNKFLYRAARHAAFWLVYSAYLFLFNYDRYDFAALVDPETYPVRFANLLLFLPVTLSIVYFQLYFLFSKLLLREKYFAMLWCLLLMCALLSIYTYLMLNNVLIYADVNKPLNTTSSNSIIDFFISNGLMYPMMALAFATGIKLAKSWYFKTREEEQLLKQKMRTELDTLKIQFHPHTLLQALNNLKEAININSNFAQVMILNLSDLLSYILYESKVDFILFEKEIAAIEKYLSLAIPKHNNNKKNYLQINGEIDQLYVPPMVLFLITELLCSQYLELENKINNSLFTILISVKKQQLDIKFIVNGFAEKKIIEISKQQFEKIKNKLDLLFKKKYLFDQNVSKTKIINHLSFFYDDLIQHNNSSVKSFLNNL